MIGRVSSLAAVVDGHSQTDRAGRKVATNATNGALIGGVGVVNGASIGSDRRTDGGVESVTDLHTLDSQVGVLGLDSRDIESGPAVVGARTKVELTPGGSVGTVAVGRDSGTLSGSPATLGVGIESNVAGLTRGEGEVHAGIAVPSVHSTVRAVLVPDNNGPVLGVVTLELNNVLVGAGAGLADLDDVATVGVADVTLVGVAGAGAASAGTEARGRVAAGGLGGSPGGGGGGCGSLAAGHTLRASQSAGGKCCQQHNRLGELHVVKE